MEDFKAQFDKLKRKSTYRSIEQDILNYFFAPEKSGQSFLEGTRLNGQSEIPYIKKRLKGRGGWRFYYLVIIKDECLYLLFFHPKTGSEGAENIADDFKTSIYKKVLSCIKSGDLYEVEKEEKANKLRFTHLLQTASALEIIKYKTINKNT
ncbi:hypothetical protein FW774_11105 [Pedobacter sp. BS3]|uniref:hypothetical protein n=1 Tax=Pedobacter sp. BS3 TaxID=2567937 RepID=UPI0011EE8812|nr:hypothetical protein [Pedobacter sp. BS3]TZF83987.1 hypothetical protein FW774_11105 [Pedobacter sp. BS3]